MTQKVETPDHDNRCTTCGRFAPSGSDQCTTCAAHPERPLRSVQETQLEDGDKEYRLLGGAPHTFEEVREKLELDEERWEVTRWNRWEQAPNAWCHQIRCSPREDVISVREIVEDALQTYREQAPPPEPVTYGDLGARDLLGEIMIPDHHIRMLAYAPETREVHYDSEIGARLFRGALEDLAERIERLAGRPPEKWVLPVGNDLAHADRMLADGSGAATASGTAVDVDTRRKRSYKIIRHVLEQGILHLRNSAPVEVVVVAGNHAPDTEYTLGELLDARFHADTAVKIHNPESDRHYHRHGRVLLGFTHGDDVAKSRLPMLMPIEAPEMWAKTDHREWHLGHTHHLDQRGFAMEAEEDTSIRLRRCPTLCPSDAWHASQGLKHVRAAEAYMYSRAHGFEGLVNCTPQAVEGA